MLELLLVGLGGGLLPLLVKWNDRRLHIALALSTGIFLGAVFLHMLPELPATIADANITTLIASLVLFSFGTGAVKGFAVTLSIGIITSMFTAIVVSRAVINLIYGGRKVEELAI